MYHNGLPVILGIALMIFGVIGVLTSIINLSLSMLWLIPLGCSILEVIVGVFMVEGAV